MGKASDSADGIREMLQARPSPHSECVVGDVDDGDGRTSMTSV